MSSPKRLTRVLRKDFLNVYCQTRRLLCVLLGDGQTGVATRGDTGEAQENKVNFTHESYRDKAQGSKVKQAGGESREQRPKGEHLFWGQSGVC